MDPTIYSRTVERQQSAFAVSHDSNRDRSLRVYLCKPIHEGQHLLNFVPNNVPTHLKRHSVDQFQCGMFVIPALDYFDGDAQGRF